MPWAPGWPPNPVLQFDTYLQNWEWIHGFDDRLRKIYIASGAGGQHYPQPCTPWYKGIVQATPTATQVVLRNAIDGSVPTWDITGTFSNPWSNANVTGAPSSWNLIIHNSCSDPRKVIEAEIQSWGASSGVLTLANYDRWRVQRCFTNYSDLVGKWAFIIGRGKRWWFRRRAEWPNSQILEQGVVAASGSTSTSLIAVDKAWPVGYFNGKDVMFLDGAGGLQRGRITATAASTLTITDATAAPAAGGVFEIIAADGYYQWGRRAHSPIEYYRGICYGMYTHGIPDDVLTHVNLPVKTINLAGTNYDLVSHAGAADVDLYTSLLDEDFPDFHHNPMVPTTWRWRQGFLLSVCGFFAKHVGGAAYYDRTGRRRIINFTPALLLEHCNINAQRVIIGAGPNVALTVPWTPIDVFWTILDSDGVATLSGWDVYDGTNIAGFTDPQLVGMTVVVSLGLTRHKPKRFLTARQKVVFLPDVRTLDEFGDPLPLGPEVVYPPEDPDVNGKGPGTWHVRQPSTHYLEAAHDSSLGEEDPPLSIDAIANGDIARFIADNNLGTLYKKGDLTADGEDVDTRYWDALYNGRLDTTNQLTRDAQFSGTITSATPWSITDSSKDWWWHWWGGGGANSFSVTSTSTGGGDGFLEDSAGTGFAWDNDWMVDHLITITSGANAGKKVPITSVGPGKRLNFPTGLITLSAGIDYTVRFPKHERNFFASLKVQVRNPSGGAWTEVTITHNDDKTLVFAKLGFTPDLIAFQIIGEFVPGYCYKRVAGAWVVPTGTDARPDPDQVFPSDPRSIVPDYVKRYGFIRPGDYLQHHITYELFLMADSLNARGLEYTFISNDEANSLEAISGMSGDPPNMTWQAAKDLADTDWDTVGLPDPITVEGDPFALSYGETGIFGGDVRYLADLGRRYAYPRLTGVALGDDCKLTATAHWFTVGHISNVNTSTGRENHSSLVQGTTTIPLLDGGGFTGLLTRVMEFDANGDPVSLNQLHLFGSTAVNTDGLALGPQFGNLTKPVWVAQPPDPDQSNDNDEDPDNSISWSFRMRGYGIEHRIALVIFNM